MWHTCAKWFASVARIRQVLEHQSYLDRFGQTELESGSQIPPAEAAEAPLPLRHLWWFC